MAASQAHLSPRFAWHMPVQIRFGTGTAEEAAEELRGRQVVVLSYPGALRHAEPARWSRAAADSIVDWIEVPEGLSTLALGRQMAFRVWPTLAAHDDPVLVALGGGSVMDVAKWVRCRPHDGAVAKLNVLFEATALPADWTRHTLWLMPTTAGTGSEVTRWSTLWDTDAEPAVKRSFDQPYAYGDRAIVDPRFVMSCPRDVTRDSALDALGHALEVLWNRHRNPLSVSLAQVAAKRVLANLPLALADSTDTASRQQLSLAALEAGVAFSQTRTALAHALSYRLTLELGVSHGVAVAVWLPITWRLALGCDPAVDESLSCVLGAPAEHGPAHLNVWFSRIGFDASLDSLGIDDADTRIREALLHARGRNFVGGACGS